jgi:hypothetical protein
MGGRPVLAEPLAAGGDAPLEAFVATRAARHRVRAIRMLALPGDASFAPGAAKLVGTRQARSSRDMIPRAARHTPETLYKTRSSASGAWYQGSCFCVGASGDRTRRGFAVLASFQSEADLWQNRLVANPLTAGAITSSTLETARRPAW